MIELSINCKVKVKYLEEYEISKNNIKSSEFKESKVKISEVEDCMMKSGRIGKKNNRKVMDGRN